MKAMVLCAGLGTRLGELTRETPKPMLPLAGHPLLAHVLAHLAEEGFRDLAVNLHFQGETIRRHFGDGSRWGVRLTYSYEARLMGTAGGVKCLQAFFQREPVFLVHYADVLNDQDLQAMVGFHRERHALLTLLVHRRAASNSIVELDSRHLVTGFRERPPATLRAPVGSTWVNSGVYLCDPQVFEFIPDGEPCDFPRDVFPRLIESERLYAFPLTGYRCAIDSPERLAEAQRALAEGRCRSALLAGSGPGGG